MSSGICENCYQNSKRRERDKRGNTVIYPYCDSCDVRRHEAAQSSIFPVSSIPIPAAAPVSASTNSVKLWSERANTPIERSIVRTLQERWQSDTLGAPLPKGVHRIDLPKEIYRRFDLALQMNDGCPVTTTYYGGIASCNIVDNPGSTPCDSEVCEICDVLRTSFGNLPYGISSRDGAHGSGLYTHRNPAVAHSVALSQSSSDSGETSHTNYALIQCRLVAGESSQSSRPYTGFIDDSGGAFCAHPASIIPTHLLIYRVVPSSVNHLEHSRPLWTSNASNVKGKGLTKDFGSGSNAASASSLTGSSSATQGVPDTQTAGGKTSRADVERSAKTRSARNAVAGKAPIQQVLYQSNLSSPGPGTLYVITPSGPIPVQQAPPGATLFVMGPDGHLHPTQAPASGDDLNNNSKSPLPRSSRPASISYSPAGQQNSKAAKQSFYPAANYGSTHPVNADQDEELRANAAAARGCVKNIDSRLDEDDDFGFLNEIDED